MAGTQVQRRRGTTVEHSTFTGAVGELTVDTTKKTVVVHDGTTAGGFPVPTLAGAETLTNKTVALGSNTVSGTKAQFDTACSDGNFVYSGDAPSLATITLTGGQIAFPATQAASGDANTLDDYEEGTFTPTIVSSGGGAPTYTTQVGNYTKIGNRVFGAVSITLATKGTLAAGSVTVAGLPFTSGTGPFAAAVSSGSTLTTPASLQADINSATTAIRLFTFSAGVSATMTVADLAATQIIRAEFNYIV